ncbi:hypothetical protein AG1IA_01464 [Rhizoctonia solani AG-1 IA]|uniref:Uncharacterized protein n=1 Tax=Thanatephorus cucumeris (strain AG1-IA) TaxID=983506 RepID=L8X5X7_THACA|nr:hypothetical protein AG1IA_01464 [Rhizoctonia solani AG-1 IA]
MLRELTNGLLDYRPICKRAPISIRGKRHAPSTVSAFTPRKVESKSAYPIAFSPHTGRTQVSSSIHRSWKSQNMISAIFREIRVVQQCANEPPQPRTMQSPPYPVAGERSWCGGLISN